MLGDPLGGASGCVGQAAQGQRFGQGLRLVHWVQGDGVVSHGRLSMGFQAGAQLATGGLDMALVDQALHQGPEAGLAQFGGLGRQHDPGVDE